MKPLPPHSGTPPPPTRAVVCHCKPNVRETLRRALRELDIEVFAEATTRKDLAEILQSDRPDIVITALDLEDGDAISLLVEACKLEPFPAVVVTHKDSLSDVERALQDHVMAYLLEPVDEEQILPTVYLVLRRFEQFQALRDQVADLQQALSDRKLIERAKGLLMAHATLDEPQAFRKLQKAASDQRIKLIEIARQVIAAHEAKLATT